MVLAKGLRDDLKEEVLISGGGDGAIKLWTIGGEDGTISELHKLDDGRDEGDSVLSLVLDGTFLYAGRINGEVNVWDLETRQLVRNLRTKTEDVLALSLGGGYLFCAGVSGTVDVSWWHQMCMFPPNFEQKYNSQYELVSRFKAHNGRILASAFTRFRNQFFYITGGNDDTITIWNISDCVQGSLTGVKTSNGMIAMSMEKAKVNKRYRKIGPGIEAIRLIRNSLLGLALSGLLPKRCIASQIGIQGLWRSNNNARP